MKKPLIICAQDPKLDELNTRLDADIAMFKQKILFHDKQKTNMMRDYAKMREVCNKEVLKRLKELRLVPEDMNEEEFHIGIDNNGVVIMHSADEGCQHSNKSTGENLARIISHLMSSTDH
ncbi:MAG: hypothetical protein EOP06_05300 [Proteobacteria bacterium]|nr:MAG: hypothetical protein EOP06_05300 [Pseudomonadota bacterium]